MRKSIVTSILAAAMLVAVPANAETEKMKAPEGYEFTGEVKRSVRVRSIKRTDVVDDYTILFFMTGKKIYANVMERRCAGLSREERFGYTLHVGQLTDMDVITVFDTFGVTNHCGLGKFHEVVKVEEAKQPEE